MDRSVHLSVIIPCYNEEATILDVLERVRAQHVPSVEIQIVVVDDGSSDRTPALLAAHPDLYDVLVTQRSNRGKGAAVRAGLAAASGSYVLFQDADLEYSPSDYPKLLMPVLEYDADIVMGSRLGAAPCTRVAYFWHSMGNRAITLLFNLFHNTTFTDIYSCFLLMRRSLLDGVDLDVDGWAQQAEILGKIVPRARRVYEVPISYFGRTYEEGKKIRWYHVVEVFETIAAVKVTGGRASRFLRR